MSRVDPPYPSISSVLSFPQARNAQSSRLPTYRSTHMGRYHPYPRIVRTHCQERLLDAMELRYEEEALWEEPAEEPVDEPLPQDRRARPCEEVLARDYSLYEDEPLPATPRDEVGTVEAEAPPPTQGDLVSALADLLTLLRRKYFSFGAVKRFLQVEPPKKA
ncbi:hypothetical protein C8Q78DRAFT_1079322 [Trametes maxima]|nr:hypothetical protein C8Q78DRAFT_1079322 [Trametes maxima]